MTDLRDFLQTWGQRTEQTLDRLLPKETGVEKRLYSAMRYSVFAGGKRLRPGLFCAASLAFGQDPAPLLPFAAGLEMIHTYSLIHDDLPAMDNDDLRRGKPTCHRAFDEATAILAGDGLLTQAFAVMLSTPADPARLLAAVAATADLAGCGGMVAGQGAELASPPEQIDPGRLDYINRGKTGALLTASLLSAAHLCGSTEEQRRALESYGYHCGRAFQIIDDVLDVSGDPALLGKAVGSDAKNDTRTYASLLGCAAARQEAALSADVAVAALAGFDEKADILRVFPRYFVERDR